MEVDHRSQPPTVPRPLLTLGRRSRLTLRVSRHWNPRPHGHELFQLLTSLDLLDVPYRGAAPALTDLLAAQVHVIFDDLQPRLDTSEPAELRAGRCLQ